VSLVGVGEEEEVRAEGYDQGIDHYIGDMTLRSVSERLPHMIDATLAGGWSGLFTVTPDWHPVLGKVPEIDGLYCATGFSGHGFKLSPMVGVVMSELVTSKESTSIDISSLSLERFETGALLESSYGMRVLA
jgi:sarcosine oxidase subunit beta